jgi:hypothetical protein
VVLTAAAAAGCGPGRTAPAGTGAEAVVRDFYEALARGDANRAYADLDADSRARVGPDAFAGLARAYRVGLGFEPGAVQVRSCEEHGDEAVAHVVLTGRAEGRERRFTDGAALRRGPGGWGVVLPPGFGRGR